MKVFILVTLSLISLSVTAQVELAKDSLILATRQDTIIKNNVQVIDSVINYGKTFLGRPYRYRGMSAKGFDCSGFIRFIFQKYGYDFPHSSSAYDQIGDKISKDSVLTVKKGDLLLFKGRNIKQRRIGHVAMVIEVSDHQILMMHSCCDKGVAIEELLTSAYYPKRLLQIRRLNNSIP